MTPPIRKYPRTRHIEGSRLQHGDDDQTSVPFDEIKGLPLVVEEKIDGANCAVSFDENGELLLQSRGHYLTGGVREKHFNLLKQWAATHRQTFFNVLENRYVMYGEWVYAKHTVFYDRLPHYFLEFDVLDRHTDRFLDTPSRRELLATIPIEAVPVLKSSTFAKLKELVSLIGHSRFIGAEHLAEMVRYCKSTGLNADTACRETERSAMMEGLYIKHEQDGQVIGRYKYVRAGFLQTVLASESHWLARPIIPNRLVRKLDDLFLPQLPPILEGDEQ